MMFNKLINDSIRVDLQLDNYSPKVLESMYVLTFQDRLSSSLEVGLHSVA